MDGIYSCSLFKGLSKTEINNLLQDRYRQSIYKPNELIAPQGSLYKALLFIDKGSVRGEMINMLGDKVIIEEIYAPRVIAPAILYASENKLPVDVIASETTTIISIPIKYFTQILQENINLLENFIRATSDRSIFLTHKVRMLRFGTIKSKLAAYLLEKSKEQKKLIFEISHTQQELADMFGVTRPALSRALSQLTETGAINYMKKNFEIIDKTVLMSIFKEG